MRRLSACALALVLHAVSARADDPAELEALLSDQVVETGTGASTGASVAPATIVTITSEDLRTFGLRTLDEAINYAAMGMITEFNMHEVEVGARGVLLNADYGNHVLLMVNGLALNEPWNGTAMFDRGAGIPMEMVDRIEIMLGAGSVMYGSQAMLGTINIITKQGARYAGLHLVAEGEAISPIGTGGTVVSPTRDHYLGDLGGAYRLGAGYGKAFELGGVPSDVSLHAESYQLHGAAVSFARQNYGLDEVTGQPKAFAPGEATGIWGGKATRSWYAHAPVGYGRLRVGDATLSVRGGMYKRAAPYLDALVRYTGDFDPPDDFQRDRWVDVELAYGRQVSEREHLSVRAFVNYNFYEWYISSSAQEDCEPGQTSGCRHDVHGIGRRYGLELKSKTTWRDRFQQTTMIGTTGQVRDVDSRFYLRAPEGDVGPIGPVDLVDLAGAAFVEHTARPTSWIDLNLGLRFDADQRSSAPHLSPRAAIAFSLWSGATLKGLYSDAFRAPSAYELYYQDQAEVPAGSLAPEVTHTAEVTFEQRLGPHRLFLGGYQTWWDRMIFLETLDPAEAQAEVDAGHVAVGAVELSRYENAGEIHNFGLNAGYRVNALGQRLFFETTVTAAHTRYEDMYARSGRPPVAAQLFGNARISYDLPDDYPVLALAMGFRDRRYADRYYDGEFARPPVAPGAVELKGTVTGALRALPGLSYRLSANYVTSGRAAYVTGPVQYASDESSRAVLQPINRLYAYLGLQYDWAP